MGWFSTQRSQDVVRMNEAVAASFQRVKGDIASVHEWIHFLHKQNEYQQHLLEWQTKELRNVTEKLPSSDDTRKLIREEVRAIKVDLEESNNELQRKVRRDLQQTHASIKHAVRRELDNYEGLQHIFQQLRHMSARVDEMAPITERLHQLEHRMEDVPTKAKIEEAFEKLQELNKKLDERREAPMQPMPQPMQPAYRAPDTAMSNLQRKVLRKVQRNSKEYVKNVMLSIIKRYQQINGLQIKEMVVDEQALVSKSSLYRLLNELELEGRINVQQDGKEKIYTFAGSATEDNPKL